MRAIIQFLCGLMGHDETFESDEGAPLIWRCDRCGWRHRLDGL